MQGIEQALQQAVQQLAAMQVQQAQTEQQLREAREREAAATGKGVRAGKGGVAGGRKWRWSFWVRNRYAHAWST